MSPVSTVDPTPGDPVPQGSEGRRPAATQEIQRGITSKLRFPGPDEDPAVFDGIPKVTVTRDSDGEVLLADATPSRVGASDQDIEHFTIEVPGASVSEVDLLEITWTDGASAYTTSCEVVGGFVTSLRAIEKKADLEKKTPSIEVMAEMREMALRALEDACEVAFRRRYAREVLNGSGSTKLFLKNPQPITVIKASVGGQAVDVSTLTIDPAGVLIAPFTWTAGNANVEIAYAHGYERFPLAALPVRDLAAYLLTPSPQDWNERATSRTDGDTTYSLVTAGVRGATFPLPTVNAFVDSHRFPVVV